MIKMIAVLKRKPGMSFADFKKHYEASHVPLVSKIMGHHLKAYVRNYSDGPNPFPVGIPNEYDCVTEFHYETMADLEAAAAEIEKPENAPLVREDEKRFLDVDTVCVFVADTRTRLDGVFEE